jgi:hypothetical protein
LFSFSQPGGVPSLFYNIASSLKNADIPFRLISKRDSEVYRLFSNLGIKFEFIDYDNISKKIINNKFSQNDIIIITWWEPKLLLFKTINPKLFFWNVYPDTLFNSNRIRGNLVFHRKNIKLLKKMLLKKGLFFMDDAPLDWMRNYKLKEFHNDLYLPIPIKIYFNQYHFDNLANEPIRITYISRSENWKLYPLIKIINDICQINEKYKVTINIISDNILKVKLFFKINAKFKMKSNIILNFYENIPNDKIHEFLINNSDINIGMGTACLEGAKVGIPTLLINPSNSLIGENFKYIWLYNTHNFNLGRFYNTQQKYAGCLLSEVIEKSFSNNDYLINKSIKCYSYVSTFHNIDLIMPKVIDNLNNSLLRVNDIIHKVIRYSALYFIKTKLKQRLKDN